MALFLKERIEEQKEDPENDKIIFTYPWIFEIPPPNEDDQDDEDLRINLSRAFQTSYNFTSIKWKFHLTRNWSEIRSSIADHFAKKAICYISYTLFYDNDMRFGLYSSTKTQMRRSPMFVSYSTPNREFLQKLAGEYVKRKRKAAKVVIYVEVVLPMKAFCRPFDYPKHYLNKELCGKYPEDLENDFKFVFLKFSDYTIVCSDGSVPALRMVLNLTSEYMSEYLDESKDVELIVTDHSIDVVKPIIYYLHSLCFQMPKSFDLDFADRLLEAIDFFEPKEKRGIERTIHLSLCKKFVEEPIDFSGILHWLRICVEHDLDCLWKMICALIANKFYFKWAEKFPRNARNPENPLYREIFGPDSQNYLEEEHDSVIYRTFKSIESAFFSSLVTNVILD